VIFWAVTPYTNSSEKYSAYMFKVVVSEKRMK
jgi:hypothetical protein